MKIKRVTLFALFFFAVGVVGQVRVLAQADCYLFAGVCSPVDSNVSSEGVIIGVTEEVNRTVLLVRPEIAYSYMEWGDVWSYDSNRYSVIVSNTVDSSALQFGQAISVEGQLAADNTMILNTVSQLDVPVVMPILIDSAPFVVSTMENSMTISFTNWTIGGQVQTLTEAMTLTLMLAENVTITSEEGRLEDSIISSPLFGTFAEDGSTVHYIGQIEGDVNAPCSFSVTGEVVEIVRPGEIVIRTADNSLMPLSFNRWVEITGVTDQLIVGLTIRAVGESHDLGYGYYGYGDPYVCPIKSGVGSIETVGSPLSIELHATHIMRTDPSLFIIVAITTLLFNMVLFWAIEAEEWFKRP